MRALPLAGQQAETGIVGRSLATLRLRAEIARVAAFSSNVLITGPSGTGKELVARQIHACSPRAGEPFIPVDCACNVRRIDVESVVRARGGGIHRRNCISLGCFRAANHGTIFLDEIGELEYSLQAKLLRVLQDHVVTAVGSHQGQQVDVRVVAATNRNLRSDVLERRFREDLYYRLEVVHLRTTSLRDRPEDIGDLAGAFLRQLALEGLPVCSLSPDATAVLVEFHWPGNVRQLRNVLEQAAIDSTGTLITGELLRRIISVSFATEGTTGDATAQSDCREPRAASPPSCMATQGPIEHLPADQHKDSQWPTLEHLQREHILRTLEHTFYNRSAAARLLGLTRQSLLRMMKRYGLDRPDKGGNL